MFPEASSFARVIEIKNTEEPLASGSVERSCLDREHRVYASLCRDLNTSKSENCISDAICASSTDNYPEESIKNTLVPSDRVGHRASYWSSKGATNPSAPESLVYKLASQLCVITEFHLHPFQAYFQFGFPIYSSKAVRLQIGHLKGPLDLESGEGNEFPGVQHFPEDKFAWTYSSPEFPMVQENCLQKFKLPEPILCIGGILRVELLGRVQTQEMDGQYYICINHVQVVGRTLSPAFDVEKIDEQGKCTLKYNPERICNSSALEMAEAESSSRSHIHRFSESLRTWERLIVNTFQGAGPVNIDDYDSDYDFYVE
ncbi:F-box protein at4g00755 [Phtheirospermum japonicum]|uniref:F-box protein at4g00755 n=1 Tax=Phtheirospermum japonicum TaxID=374723 RepID=A0A830BLK4_9LAMI|nr:F-box protein at4g00755 [Phtheirospermum japonicum]